MPGEPAGDGGGSKAANLGELRGFPEPFAIAGP
jgi:hypothetical protein